MKKAIIGFLFLAMVGGVLPAYAKRNQDVKVQINKSVTTNGLKIEFVELVEDSRCPADVECVWAGNAKIKVRVTKGRKSQVLNLDLATNGTKPTYGNYRLTLKGLTPELRSNVRINRNAYIATIEVTKIR